MKRMNRMMLHAVTKYCHSSLGIRSSPGVRGLDADEGAGDDLDVAKKRGYPNNDNLIIVTVVVVSTMMTVMVVRKRRRLMMLSNMKKGPVKQLKVAFEMMAKGGAE